MRPCPERWLVGESVKELGTPTATVHVEFQIPAIPSIFFPLVLVRFQPIPVDV